MTDGTKLLWLCAVILAGCGKQGAENPTFQAHCEQSALKDRSVFIEDAIGERAAKKVADKLMALDAETTNRPIVIYINSPGGGFSAGLKILKTMSALKSEVRTVGVGEVHCMAAMILAAGTRGSRSATKDLQLRFLTVFEQGFGFGPISEERQAELDLANTLAHKIVARFTGMGLEKVKELFTTNKALSATEAKALGIIDVIMER